MIKVGVVHKLKASAMRNQDCYCIIIVSSKCTQCHIILGAKVSIVASPHWKFMFVFGPIFQQKSMSVLKAETCVIKFVPTQLDRTRVVVDLDID